MSRPFPLARIASIVVASAFMRPAPPGFAADPAPPAPAVAPPGTRPAGPIEPVERPEGWTPFSWGDKETERGAPAGVRALDAADDDQGVPRISAPVAGPATDSQDPLTWNPRHPPLGQAVRAKSRIRLRTDPVVFGQLEPFTIDEGTVAYVLVGNPVVEGDDFTIKADALVVWLDSTRTGDALGLAGAPGGARPPAERASGGPRLSTSSAGGVSVLPDALIAIYAVGSVDLLTGEIAFRASELYVDARHDRALLIEPRFDTTTPIAGTRPIPIHVRARTLRTLTEGFAVFEKGDVSTSRANDRIGLEVAILTMEEFAGASAGKPTFLGFHTAGSQRFTGRGIVGRAERLPLFYVPEAAFGGENGLTDFPVRVRSITTGARSSLGRYGIVGAGARQQLATDTYVDWTATVGAYSKRGVGAGYDLSWKQLAADRTAPPRLSGRFETFGIYDGTGDDRDDFDAGEGLRWKALLENRYEVTRSLRFDTEVNVFSDRGFNREFFDSDARSHKDRETYARLRWMEGGVAATLSVGAHLRDFVTETIEQPGVALWSESMPLGETSGPVRLAFDLSSAATISRIGRRFDEELPDRDYDAFRIDVTERVYAPFDVGDVRVSPFVGVRYTGWFDRTDGGDDLDRTALEAGVRANLQLHRDFAVAGGRWRLDGLRHVIDLDVGAFARGSGGVDRDEVPYFDRVDGEESRTEFFVEVRNRLETRRVAARNTGGARAGEGAGERRNSTLADLRIKGSFWPDEIGPYGRRGPGQIEMWGMAEIAPDAAWLRGEAVIGLEGATFRHWSLGAQWSPSDVVSAAVGVRHVQDEVLAPWFEVYRRWNEKWGVRFSGIRDFDSGARARTCASRSSGSATITRSRRG